MAMIESHLALGNFGIGELKRWRELALEDAKNRRDETNLLRKINTTLFVSSQTVSETSKAPQSSKPK